MLLNPLFLVMGQAAHWLHLPLIAVYHLSRLAFGALLIVATWWIISLFVQPSHARRFALLMVCFSAGLGWLPIPWEIFPSPYGPAGPVDNWQPEAITFLSLYLSPLFCFSLALQIAIIALLWKAEITRRFSYTISAGLLGAILGLTHTYDIISVSAVWCVFLISGVLPQKTRAVEWSYHTTLGSICRALVAGAIALPSVAYIYHALQTEATFNKRMNVVTGTTGVQWVLLGYGITLILAIYAVWGCHRTVRNSGITEQNASQPDAEVTLQTSKARTETGWLAGGALRLLVSWAIANIMVAFLPVSKFPFQRKMLQGAHLPIAILAGVGIALLLQTPTIRRQVTNPKMVVLLLVLLLSISNFRFMARDLTGFRDNFINNQRPYLNRGEINALQWIERNTPADAAVQPLPWIARTPNNKLALLDFSLGCVIPGAIHRKVYCGHWGETPDYPSKIQDFIKFSRPDAPDAYRRELLTRMGVQYLIYSQRDLQDGTENPFHPFLSDPSQAPPYLRRVYSNRDADVYEIDGTMLKQQTR